MLKLKNGISHWSNLVLVITNQYQERAEKSGCRRDKMAISLTQYLGTRCLIWYGEGTKTLYLKIVDHSQTIKGIT